MHKLLTLNIVHQNGKVLLGMKKRGFGEGRWNGFGGKVAEGETVEEGAMRETYEEAGIVPSDLVKLGVLEFVFEGQEDDILETHVFKSTSFEGEAGESEEMKPQWFAEADIPFASMWKDDILWFPYFLQNKKFTGRFLFDSDHNIVEQKLALCEELPK